MVNNQIIKRVPGVIQTSIAQFLADAQSNSLWPLLYGTDHCAVEMIAAVCAKYDLARLGSEVFRPTPRQADLLIVSGVITISMADRLHRLYEQMPDPKFVIAFGSGAINGGPFADSYNVVAGVDKIVPVDIYVPGDPPYPEQLIDAILMLQKRIKRNAISKQDIVEPT